MSVKLRVGQRIQGSLLSPASSPALASVYLFCAALERRAACTVTYFSSGTQNLINIYEVAWGNI